MNRVITLQDVWMAKRQIRSYVQKTPLIFSESLSKLIGKHVYLKLENVNITNSFKIRGAANKILSLSTKEKEKGITTFSTGNFGLSVAYMAKALGMRAVICISQQVPQSKVDKLIQLDAEIKRIGNSQDEAEKYAYKLEKEKGLTVIHPFDDPHVIAGQGTIALEILEDLPKVDTILAGLSGGGLLSGLGLVMKRTNPSIQIIGVSPKNGAVMYESIQKGLPIEVEERPSLADSLLGGIGLRNKFTFGMVQQYVDDLVLLTEKEIADGILFTWKKHGMVIEGAGATGVSTLIHEKASVGSTIVIVVSGGNVDPSIVLKL